MYWRIFVVCCTYITVCCWGSRCRGSETSHQSGHALTLCGYSEFETIIRWNCSSFCWRCLLRELWPQEPHLSLTFRECFGTVHFLTELHWVLYTHCHMSVYQWHLCRQEKLANLYQVVCHLTALNVCSLKSEAQWFYIWYKQSGKVGETLRWTGRYNHFTFQWFELQLMQPKKKKKVLLIWPWWNPCLIITKLLSCQTLTDVV